MISEIWLTDTPSIAGPICLITRIAPASLKLMRGRTSMRMLVLPRISFKDAGAMRVIKQMGPAILGVSVSQISLIINT